MPYSYTSTVASGSTATFSVPFGYIEKEHVHVYVDTVEVDFEDLVWPTSSSITLPGLASSYGGKTVLIKRETPTDENLVIFGAGSLSSADINTSNLQLLYISQEAQDAAADARAAADQMMEDAEAAKDAAEAAQAASELAAARAEEAAALGTSLYAGGDDDDIILNGRFNWPNPPFVGVGVEPYVDSAAPAAPVNTAFPAWHFGPGDAGTVRIKRRQTSDGAVWAGMAWTGTTSNRNTVEYPGTDMQDVIEQNGNKDPREKEGCTVRIFFRCELEWAINAQHTTKIFPKLWVSTGIREWQTGQSVASGEYIGKWPWVYRAAGAGTTGATAPSHTSGSVSDGGVTFEFIGPAKGYTYDVYKAFRCGKVSDGLPAASAGTVIACTGANNTGAYVTATETDDYYWADIRIPMGGHVNTVDYAATSYTTRTLLPFVEPEWNKASGGTPAYLGVGFSTCELPLQAPATIWLTDIYSRTMVLGPAGYIRKDRRRDELLRGEAVTPYDGGTGQVSYTKGDLLVGVTKNYFGDLEKIGVGPNDTILMADSTQTKGLAWKEPVGWTVDNPTVTVATPGSFAATCTRMTSKWGKSLKIKLQILISNAGTATSPMTVPLGYTASSSAAFTLHGAEMVSTGHGLQGYVAPGDNKVTIVKYDGTFPSLSAGSKLVLEGEIPLP